MICACGLVYGVDIHLMKKSVQGGLSFESGD